MSHQHVENIVIRPVSHDDTSDILKLAIAAGPGMSLPTNENKLQEKIEGSIRTFAGDIKDPQEQLYWLVTENQATQDIIGISGIYPDVGEFPSFVKDNNRLELNYDLSNLTEIGTLVVSSRHRQYEDQAGHIKAKIGAITSAARFQFMAHKPDSFANQVFAEIRGFETNGVNHFHDRAWGETLHTLFKKAGFAQTDAHIQKIGHDSLSEHWDKVSKDLKGWAPNDLKYIGRPHKVSQKAAAILMGQNFTLRNSCDTIAGGPHLICNTDKIQSVLDTQTVRSIEKTNADRLSPQSIKPVCISTAISNSFRLAIRPGYFDHETGQLLLMSETNQLLDQLNCSETSLNKGQISARIQTHHNTIN